MIDLEIPAGVTVIVHTHDDGRMTISLPESVVLDAVFESAPLREIEPRNYGLSCVYPVDDPLKGSGSVEFSLKLQYT